MKKFVLAFNWKLKIPSGRMPNVGSTVIGVTAANANAAKAKARLRFFTKTLRFTSISSTDH